MNPVFAKAGLWTNIYRRLIIVADRSAGGNEILNFYARSERKSGQKAIGRMMVGGKNSYHNFAACDCGRRRLLIYYHTEEASDDFQAGLWHRFTD